MSTNPPLNRRQFLAGSLALFFTSCVTRRPTSKRTEPAPERIIDIHQHTPFSGRDDDALVAHQRARGITTTFLLPAGSPVERPSTHGGRSNGLAVGAGGNEAVLSLARKYPGEFFFFANEVPDLPHAKEVLEKYLKLGAQGIGEQKFDVRADSREIYFIAELAREYDVPVLLHFQEGAYNSGLANFHKVLERFPQVNFIGHAQSWWGNVDKSHDQAKLYPGGPITSGGLTDQLLSDYPNMYADQSAGSGLNALLRDEDHARWFLNKHQDKLLYGSDCSDAAGSGPECQGAGTLDAIRRLAPNRQVEEKILSGNAKRLFKL